MGGSVSSLACAVLTGVAGEGKTQVQPSTPASPSSLTAHMAQSSLVLPQSPVKPLQRGPELLCRHTCNVLPHFKHYKVLTGSCSEYNILPSSGFPPCSSRFLHGNKCKWRAPQSPCALDSNCITVTRAQVTE